MGGFHQKIQRHAVPRLKELCSHFAVVAVTGARQIGKTTLLQMCFPSMPMVTFDPVVDVQNARADPELFLANHPPALILDEIQYVPELIAAIKRRVDQNRSARQYIVTGSQQWNVMKRLAESLAGRVVFLDLDCFNLAETNEKGMDALWLKHWLEGGKNSFGILPVKKSLYSQVWTGLMPEAQFLPDTVIGDYFQAYVRTYVERDVRLMADISDVSLFTRFYRLCAALTAQELNASHMGRELGLSPQTAARWLNMLEATFQWVSIPPFTHNAIKKIARKSKGYFLDTGLACWAQAIQTSEVLGSHPQWGALFETFVVNDIRKQARLVCPAASFYHWRAHSGAEVDLIIEYGGRYYPIEIKGKSRPTPRDVLGLMAFRKAYPRLNIADGLVVCAGEESYALTEKDYVLPWKTG